MSVHGSHWAALYGDDFDVKALINRGIEKGTPLDKYSCANPAGDTELSEQVFCVRWGEGPIFEDILIVSDSRNQRNLLFSLYPTIEDGVSYQLRIDRIEPWEGGLEAWVHAQVLSLGLVLDYFDTHYYSGDITNLVGKNVDVMLSGLAYSLRPCTQSSIEISSGGLFEVERARRLEDGQSDEQANEPVKVLLSGMSAFLPRDGDQKSDVEFRGPIKKIDQLTHDGKKFYRLEVTVARDDDVEFDFPIHV